LATRPLRCLQSRDRVWPGMLPAIPVGKIWGNCPLRQGGPNGAAVYSPPAPGRPVAHRRLNSDNGKALLAAQFPPAASRRSVQACPHAISLAGSQAPPLGHRHAVAAGFFLTNFRGGSWPGHPNAAVPRGRNCSAFRRELVRVPAGGGAATVGLAAPGLRAGRWLPTRPSLSRLAQGDDA